MAHGGEQKRDFFLVVRDVGGFGIDLAHEDQVASGIGAIEARDRGRQLIAQNQDDVSSGRVFSDCHAFRYGDTPLSGS